MSFNKAEKNGRQRLTEQLWQLCDARISSGFDAGHVVVALRVIAVPFINMFSVHNDVSGTFTEGDS